MALLRSKRECQYSHGQHRPSPEPQGAREGAGSCPGGSIKTQTVCGLTGEAQRASNGPTALSREGKAARVSSRLGGIEAPGPPHPPSSSCPSTVQRWGDWSGRVALKPLEKHAPHSCSRLPRAVAMPPPHPPPPPHARPRGDLRSVTKALGGPRNPIICH